MNVKSRIIVHEVICSKRVTMKQAPMSRPTPIAIVNKIHVIVKSVNNEVQAFIQYAIMQSGLRS